MTFAELAAHLGVDIDRKAEFEDAPPAGAPPIASGRDVIAERLAHARGEGPEPVPDPTPPGVLVALGAGLIGPPGADPSGRP